MTINDQLISESWRGHLQIIEDLVSKGADVQARDNQALVEASNSRHLQILKYLISKGADVQARDNYSLITASHDGNLQLVEYLVSKGANVQAQNNQALINASRNAIMNGDFKMIKYLVSKGADVKAQDNKALSTVSRICNLQITEYLVSKGANAYKINPMFMDKEIKKYKNIIIKLLEENNYDLYKKYKIKYKLYDYIQFKHFVKVDAIIGLGSSLNKDINILISTYL